MALRKASGRVFAGLPVDITLAYLEAEPFESRVVFLSRHVELQERIDTVLVWLCLPTIETRGEHQRSVLCPIVAELSNLLDDVLFSVRL